MGPCYCDCRDLGCRILHQSRAEARRLGLVVEDPADESSRGWTALPAVPFTENQGEPSSYVQDVFRISLLEENPEYLHRLIGQAQELVRHSRDTFWLGSDVVLSSPDDEKESLSSLCELENLARIIFQQHWNQYGLASLMAGDDETSLNHHRFLGGAEWWVQVKSVSAPPPAADEEQQHGAKTYNLSQPPPQSLRTNNGAEAVDLHYDKDEALAESFGLGVFPTLSTVTYLTTTVNSASPPTVIFSQRYDETDSCISDMLLSHPAPFKHLVFDGRLLHGAPAHHALRRRRPNDHVDDDEPLRITFLVNLWLDHQPAGVERLPDDIRHAIIHQASSSCSNSPTDSGMFTVEHGAKRNYFVGPLRPIPRVELNSLTITDDDDDESSPSARSIELPFVGGKATWGGNGTHADDDDSDTAAMVLATLAPPPHSSDTLLVHFAPGLEASLQYSGTEDDDDDCDDDAET